MNSKDLKLEIEKLTNIKNWKRESKFKAYDRDNDEVIILRKFTSNKSPLVVFVKESSINGNCVFDIVKPDTFTFKDFDPYKLVSVSKVVKDEDGDYEELDLENYEITIIDNSTVNIWHGGDWQNPQDCIYKYYSNGMFYIESKK